MSLFTSSREKKLWFWALATVVTIFSTLFIGQPLLELLANQNVRAVFFSIGMLLVGAAIIMHSIKTKPGKIEIAVILGIIAVYTMFFLRLGMTERSHLIEYSILAIFIHKALVERSKRGEKIPIVALIAFITTFLIGVIDECVQIILPNRVFDPLDIIFNGNVAALAIASNVIFSWIRKLRGKY